LVIYTLPVIWPIISPIKLYIYDNPLNEPLILTDYVNWLLIFVDEEYSILFNIPLNDPDKLPVILPLIYVIIFPPTTLVYNKDEPDK